MTVDFFKQKYGYEIEGFWMPRVTAVTSLVSKANFFASQASADWGTLVHSTIEHILKGEKVAIDPRILPSIEIFKKWQKTHGLEIENSNECIEKRVFNKANLFYLVNRQHRFCSGCNFKFYFFKEYQFKYEGYNRVFCIWCHTCNAC